MKIYIVLLAFPLTSLACDGYVIGFGGLNGMFDRKAFDEYANIQGYCARSYAWQDKDKATLFIRDITVPHQLYGFSKGAETVSKVLKEVDKKPNFILTVGAYKTVNVNFTKYGIPFQNFFDASGKGQKSPGVFLNKRHNQMQEAVNRLLKEKNT
jgi:hypothetical protein